MSSPSVYRKFCWKIDNVFREVIHRYSKSKRISKGFTILLPENNKTQWILEFYPNSEKHCEFYIFKDRANQDNFDIKTRLYVKTASSDDLEIIDEIHVLSSELEMDEGLEFFNMFNVQKLFSETSNYIINDCLTFIVEFELHIRNNTEAPKASSNEALLSISDYEKILMCDKLSDFSLICSDLQELPVHRLIIALKCPVLLDMLDGEMAEHKNKKMKFNDIDSQTMKAFLRFLYTGNLNVDQCISLKLLYVAEKFQLSDLKTTCISILDQNISITNVMDTLIAADHYDDKVLESNCIEFIKMKLDQLKNLDDWNKLSMRHALKIMHSLDTNPVTFHFKDTL